MHIYKKKITGAIGSNEKAAIARIEGEGEIVDERSRSRRRVAVDARVGEAQAVYLDGRSHHVRTPLLLPHLLRLTHRGIESGNYQEESGGWRTERRGEGFGWKVGKIL